MRAIYLAMAFWLSISFATYMVILTFVPMPYGFLLAAGSMIIITLHFFRNVIPKVMPQGRVTFFQGDSVRLFFACLKCGYRHNRIACPKCNSKMKRLD